MADNGLLLIGLAVGAWYLLSGSNLFSSGPVYKNIHGQTITTIACGNAIVFDVPGNSLVWLTRVKNGVQDFDGIYAVPAPAYILNCSTDVGNYTVTVYSVAANGSKGTLIGSTNFAVTAQA